jgi:hypothetical protein
VAAVTTRNLDSREYKLLLDLKQFPAAAAGEAAARLWECHLKPIIATRMDPRRNGGSRAEGALASADARIVRFHDCRGRLLGASGFILRERLWPLTAEAATDAERQVTLKLRLPDYTVVAGISLPGSVAGARTKLEEDIAPLGTKPGGGLASLPTRATHSRFSLSTTQPLGSGSALHSLHDVFALYPTLRASLWRRLDTSPSTDLRLLAGPAIRETVFRGAKVRLGEGFSAAFSFTLWQAECGSPRVAEISFRCKLRDGRLAPQAAQRAHQLFTAMQVGLGDWVDRRDTSKSALALPADCPDQDWRCGADTPPLEVARSSGRSRTLAELAAG